MRGLPKLAGLVRIGLRQLRRPLVRRYATPSPARGEGLGLALGLLLTLLALPAHAADVISGGPNAVAVTIYRDEAIPDPAAADWNGYGLAMIAETRTVDLPAGQSRLVLQGVADGALPETAALQGLPGRILEQNFDYDLLGPGSLIQHSVGRPVQVRRVNPHTGKVTLEDAVLRSGPNGAVLDIGGRIEALGCSGGIEGIVFRDVPSELTGKAALSTAVTVDRPGRYQVRLAYLTVGLAWRAGYVARIAPDSTTLDLDGWITLANHGDTGFANAPTSVVAGRLARQAVNLVQRLMASRTSACWPMGNSHHPRGNFEMPPPPPPPAPMNMVADEAMMAPATIARGALGGAFKATERARQTDLGDYKLYTLDEPTTVAARQTKQLMFLHQEHVRFDRVYVFKLDLDASEGASAAGPTTTTLRLENKPANGLGRALPAGAVSIRQPQDGTDYLIGEPQLRDVSVGEPFELELGEASDVQVAWRVTAVTAAGRAGGRHRARATVEATLTNAKSEPIAAELRLLSASLTGLRVTAESQAHGTKAGDPIWRVPLPANGEAVVTYTVEYLTD